jgi:putative resolvase
VNLTEWTHAQSVDVQTAYRWYRKGTPPVPVQKAGRLVLVSPQAAAGSAGKAGDAGLYARVSSHSQKSGLDGQVAQLSTWAAKAGLPVVQVEARVGSGMNRSRAKVQRLLSDLAVTVVVEHQDRVGQMNTELADRRRPARNQALKAPGCSRQDIGPRPVKLQAAGGGG